LAYLDKTGTTTEDLGSSSHNISSRHWSWNWTHKLLTCWQYFHVNFELHTVVQFQKPKKAPNNKPHQSNKNTQPKLFPL